VTASFSNTLKNKRRKRNHPTRRKSRTWVCVEQNCEFWSINRVMHKYNQPTLAKPYFISFKGEAWARAYFLDLQPSGESTRFPLLSKTTPRNVMTSQLHNAHTIPSKTWRVLYKRRRGDSFVLRSSCFKTAGLSLCISVFPVVSVVHLKISKHPTSTSPKKWTYCHILLCNLWNSLQLNQGRAVA